MKTGSVEIREALVSLFYRMGLIFIKICIKSLPFGMYEVYVTLFAGKE
jgi:hypothetical protein